MDNLSSVPDDVKTPSRIAAFNLRTPQHSLTLLAMLPVYVRFDRPERLS
jgi:hypothetical protein